jgi:hypothetical protein
MTLSKGTVLMRKRQLDGVKGMSYWHAQLDVRHDSRTIESFGTGSQVTDFYQSYLNPPDYPATFNPETTDYRWKKGDKTPRADFVYLLSGLFSCPKEVFALFHDLLDGQIESWEAEVSGEPFVGFKPKANFDLMDENLTSFHTVPSGTKNNFKNVTLIEAPPKGTDIFGLEGGLPQNLVKIVSDEFRKIYVAHNLTGLRFAQAFRP